MKKEDFKIQCNQCEGDWDDCDECNGYGYKCLDIDELFHLHYTEFVSPELRELLFELDGDNDEEISNKIRKLCI